MRKPRVRVHQHEADLETAMKMRGFQVTKRGWPDFICVREKEVFFVEVKSNKRQKLKREQIALHRILVRHGLACLRWDPDQGFTDIDGKKVEIP